LKKWFVHTLRTHKIHESTKPVAVNSSRIGCFMISVHDVDKTRLFTIFLQKIGEIMFLAAQ